MWYFPGEQKHGGRRVKAVLLIGFNGGFDIFVHFGGQMGIELTELFQIFFVIIAGFILVRIVILLLI